MQVINEGVCKAAPGFAGSANDMIFIFFLLLHIINKHTNSGIQATKRLKGVGSVAKGQSKGPGGGLGQEEGFLKT